MRKQLEETVELLVYVPEPPAPPDEAVILKGPKAFLAYADGKLCQGCRDNGVAHVPKAPGLYLLQTVFWISTNFDWGYAVLSYQKIELEAAPRGSVEWTAEGRRQQALK